MEELLKQAVEKLAACGDLGTRTQRNELLGWFKRWRPSVENALLIRGALNKQEEESAAAEPFQFSATDNDIPKADVTFAGWTGPKPRVIRTDSDNHNPTEEEDGADAEPGKPDTENRGGVDTDSGGE